MTSSCDSIVKDYYDRKSASYDNYNKQLWCRVYDAVTWRITEPYIPRDSRAVVFDAAGGTGKWSIPIAKCGPKVVLGDISEGMLNVAKEKIRRGKLQRRIKLRQCDLRSLDFKDECFDLVFCDHALCFIKEQEPVIRELVRVLKKGHPLIISGQNRYVLSLSLVSEDSNYAYRVLSKETQFAMRKSLDVYALSPNEFKQMLENNGVTVERMVGKLFTIPLGLPGEKLASEDYTVDFFEKMLRIELELTEEPDTVSLGSHFQAVGHKPVA